MQVHRQYDLRTCGATTVAQQQFSVYCEDVLVAVEGDPNTDGGGDLTPVNFGVYVEDKLIAYNGSPAVSDSSCFVIGGNHCYPYANEGSNTVFVGDDSSSGEI